MEKDMGEKQHILKERLSFLAEAMLHLKTLDEFEIFLTDILTNQEIEIIAQRLYVAICLLEGKTFKEISSKLGVSSGTIERVNQSVLYGEGGYKVVIERICKKSI